MNWMRKSGLVRQFSTTRVVGKEYLAIIRDKPGMLSKRLEIRGQHLHAIKPLFDSNVCTGGGGIAQDHLNTQQSEQGQSPEFAGSVLSVEAESKQAVMEILKNDIYNHQGVWDLENVEIFAFFPAFRKTNSA